MKLRGVVDNLYKFLRSDGSCTDADGDFRWPLPNGKPGAWRKVKGKLVPCENGLHLVRQSGLLEWASDTLYVAECRGRTVDKDDNVIVCREARLIRRVETWNEKNLRLFACDCAERVLPIFEEHLPDDDRPRKCILVARRFARGEATEEDMAAARAALYATNAARDAAWAAARAAAWDAAWGAARDAAWGAARDAAWAAASGAARAAAWAAARDAAWAAARDAAWAAARAAARAAERAWQHERLMQYLRGEVE